MVKEEKKLQVEKLSEDLAASDAVVLSDYSGLSVAQVQTLRGKLAELGASFKVIKNTLIKLAFEKANLKDGELEGPTAVLLSQKADPIEVIKNLVSTFKEAGKGEVKFGFFEKGFLAAPQVLELSALPGKKGLQAKLVSQLVSPIWHFSNALSYGPRSLVMVLSQVANAKGGVANG
ncbi:MAG: 50S ribosomal protein L10 [Patescibacteria group bacterium]